MQIEGTQPKKQTIDTSTLLGYTFSKDLQSHIEDSIRSKEFEYASCYGCGLRVKHDGYCHRCA